MRLTCLHLILACACISGTTFAEPIRSDETPLAAATRLEAELAAAGDAATDNTTDHLRADLAEVLVATLNRPGDAGAGIALLNPVLERANATEPRDDAFVGRLHSILAQAWLAERDAKQALMHYDQSVEALTRAHGADDRRTLTARLARAVFYSRTGRPADADAESIAVVTAFRANDPDSADALRSYGQRAVFLIRLGRFADAEAEIRDLLARDDIHHALPTADRRAQLNNLAYLLNRAGRHEECATIMEQIVASDITAFGREARSTLTARFNLAYVYGDLERYDDAATLLREDLAIVEAHGAIGTFTPGDYWGRLGEMALKQRQFAAAIPDLTAALAEIDAQTDATHAEDATEHRIRSALALAQAGAGLHPDATATLDGWLNKIEERFRVRLSFTSEADRLAFAARERPLDLPATLGFPNELARAVLRFKGLVLDSLLEDQRLALASTDPEVAQLLADYQAALTDAEANAADALLGSRREQLERELARRTLTAAGHRTALATDPAAVLAALPADTALVEYLHYRDLTPGQPVADAYLALIGSASTGWQTVHLGPAAELDPALARYRILVRRGGQLDWARDVRARVLDPVRAALPAHVSRLLIAPDGALHQVAFASLPEADETFVLEHLRIQLLNTGRDLLEPTASDRPGETAPALTRILADPTDTPRPDLPPLPGARAEGLAIASRIGTDDVHIGADASPAALAAAPSPAVLHLACHTVIASDPALNHAEGLRQTGLVLAAADGFLSAARISALDLLKTRLVFLSACDSGGGEVISGEGVFGLRRAFDRAHAGSLVMTLWPVADEAAQPLINAFYEQLQRLDEPNDALNLAQREALADARSAGIDSLQILRTVGAYTISGGR